MRIPVICFSWPMHICSQKWFPTNQNEEITRQRLDAIMILSQWMLTGSPKYGSSLEKRLFHLRQIQGHARHDASSLLKKNKKKTLLFILCSIMRSIQLQHEKQAKWLRWHYVKGGKLWNHMWVFRRIKLQS